MLYKNLPDGELNGVMNVRRALDYVAILRYLLSLDIANAKAVIKARRDFRSMREEFSAARKENLGNTTAPLPFGKISGSILLKHYLGGMKHFSQMHVM
jgi:hypothetical protein